MENKLVFLTEILIKWEAEKERFISWGKKYTRAELEILFTKLLDDRIKFVKDLQEFLKDYESFVTQQTLKPEGV